jgi:uncharacterized membrane protein YfcA
MSAATDIDPVEEAARLRVQRRAYWRVLRLSGPVTALGILTLVFGGTRLPEKLHEWLAVPTVLAFFVSLVAVALLSGNQSRDFRNRFRPGSARAYEDE